VPSAVVHGRRAGAGEPASAMPTMGEVWSGRLPDHRRPWADAARAITVQEGAASVVEDAPGSPYEARFRNGATIYPRVLLFVERASAGPLGVPVGVRRVRSARSALDKPPWKHLQSLEEAVEERFILPIHLGSTITPYRALDPVEAVIPWIGDRLLDDDDPGEQASLGARRLARRGAATSARSSTARPWVSASRRSSRSASSVAVTSTSTSSRSPSRPFTRPTKFTPSSLWPRPGPNAPPLPCRSQRPMAFRRHVGSCGQRWTSRA
jgi:hypothetical protein